MIRELVGGPKERLLEQGSDELPLKEFTALKYKSGQCMFFS